MKNKEITLKNGLKIVLIEDPQAPIVSIRSFVNVGSVYESRYQGSGISHYIEHIVTLSLIHI